MTSIIVPYVDDDTIKREVRQALRDKESARQGNLSALEEEQAGLRARLAVNARNIERTMKELDDAAPHWRALHEVELNELLRTQDRLEGRVELVEIAKGRFQKK